MSNPHHPTAPIRARLPLRRRVIAPRTPDPTVAGMANPRPGQKGGGGEKS